MHIYRFIPQLIIKLLYRLTGSIPSTQSQATARCFKEGRLDVIRSTTQSSAKFVKTMLDPTTSVSFAIFKT